MTWNSFRSILTVSLHVIQIVKSRIKRYDKFFYTSCKGSKNGSMLLLAVIINLTAILMSTEILLTSCHSLVWKWGSPNYFEAVYRKAKYKYCPGCLQLFELTICPCGIKQEQIIILSIFYAKKQMYNFFLFQQLYISPLLQLS